MSEIAKPRSDSWDATLTEQQRWQCYDLFRRSPWYAVAKYAETEFGLPQPSRSSLYRWAERMRKDESAHRIEQAVKAREEVGALATTTATDARLVDAYKSLATDLALKGNAQDAIRFTTMAIQIASQSTKQQELDLKKQAQYTKEETLKLAREKFEAAEARLNEAKSVAGNVTMTDEERMAKIKEIFGM